MKSITTIGLDLAKKVFQVHGVDAAGKAVVARKLKRKEVLVYFAKLPPCLVGMEACGSAHYWAREIAKLGHTVKLMPPKYVKAYVKRGKTDAGDAAAICEAVGRPSMTFVPVKSVELQGLSMLHSARTQLVGQRTQLINALRGHLSELGIIAERGILGLGELAAIVRDNSDARLPAIARFSLMITLRQIEATSTQIAELDAMLRKENKASEVGPRLETIPSIGPVTASALRARVVDAQLFENGRHLSAVLEARLRHDDRPRAGERFDRRQGQTERALQERRPLFAPAARQRRDGHRATGAAPARQASLGRQAARPDVGQAGRHRDCQQDRADGLGDHDQGRQIRGRAPHTALSSSGLCSSGVRGSPMGDCRTGIAQP